ncbi:MAG: hypothetical protein WCE23_03515 [Candidatus Binatus sp.]|uniref:hypothetical protein n=1 Tax=Candidatus Binatus sp. TaxID=2811406 RepID=UPI003C74B61B
MASDSQGSSTGSFSVKHLNRSKLRKLDVRVMGGFGDLVIAGAGGSAFISKAAECVKQELDGNWFNSAREVADSAEDALLKVYKRHVLEKADKLGLKPSQYDAPDLGVMMAVSLARKKGTEGPVIWKDNALFTISADGIAQREDDYSTMGSGSPYAEYIIQRAWRENMPSMMAIHLAIYAVEEAKKIDPYCGGQTRVMVVTNGVAVEFPVSNIQDIVKKLSDRDENTKFLWRLSIGDPLASAEFEASTKKLQAQTLDTTSGPTTDKLVEQQVEGKEKAEVTANGKKD